MEQFTDKEIFDEFVKRFNLEKESTEKIFCDIYADGFSLTDVDENYLGNMRFTFNRIGQFIDDVPTVQLDTQMESNCSVDDMDYDDLITLLGEIADKLRNM